MKKGKKATIVLLLLLAGLLVGYWISNAAEPSYQGRRAGVWIDDLGSPKNEQARAALKAMGTNAVPAIVRRLKQSESPWHNRYRDFFPKFPRWLAKILPKPKAAVSFGFYDGALAFEAIGPSVEPSLIIILKDQNVTVREAAAMGLSLIRTRDRADIKDAIPALIEALRDQKKSVQMYSAETLGYAGPGAESAVPALIALLNDSDTEPGVTRRFYVRAAAAKSLGMIGPTARVALPSLRSLLTDNDAYLRVVAAIAIWRIDGDVTNTLPVLIQGLSQVNEGSKGYVADGIGEMGPRAKAAFPALLHELNLPPSPSEDVNWGREFENRFVTNALKKIDPEAAAKAGVK